MKTIIAGNWKMNLTVAESISLAANVVAQANAAVQSGSLNPDDVEIVQRLRRLHFIRSPRPREAA